MALLPIILVPIIFINILVAVNFITYCIKGKLITNQKIWKAIQIWLLLISPLIFILLIDLPNKNDCCGDTAVFSPGHRPTIYTIIILCQIAAFSSIFRHRILPPIAEVLQNILLIIALIINISCCFHFLSREYDFIFPLIGNLPIILMLLIILAEKHKMLKTYLIENEIYANGITGRICTGLLKLNPIIKYPLLTILAAPLIFMATLLLLIIGQKPDSLIKAFTDTYRYGFSQLDHLCFNVECGGHFLCSVGANGHKILVKPIRYGERNGGKIICTRQLLISNAFEELVQQKLPRLHGIIRKNYNKVGNMIHRHYHFFNIKLVSDVVYIMMKPLEWIFLAILYTLDQRPENRIATQYLTLTERDYINKAVAKKM